MTISRSRLPLVHRQYRGLLLPLAAVATLVVSACGGTTSKPAGIPSTADCTFSANTQYSNSGAVGGIVINGLEKDSPCGYVTRKDSAVLTLSVSLTAPCANIGTQTSPSACNDYGGLNRVYITDQQNGTGTQYFDYSWEQIPSTSNARSVGSTSYHLKPFATIFKDSVTALFSYRGDIVAAKGTAVLRGIRETTTKGLTGPSTLDVTTYGTWSVTAGSFDTHLYSYRWYVDNSLSSGDTTATLVHSIWGANAHSIVAHVILSDSTVDTVSYSVTPQLHGEITGPNTITSPDYYTWSAVSPGSNGATVTYAWSMYDPGTSTTTSIGSGSSVTLAVSQSGPSAFFTVQLSVSASGFASNSASMEVTNQLMDSCGGQSCLKYSPPKKKQP